MSKKLFIKIIWKKSQNLKKKCNFDDNKEGDNFCIAVFFYGITKNTRVI